MDRRAWQWQIEAVRRELSIAQEKGQGTDLRFNVGTVEIELSVEAIKSGRGEASVKVLNVISVGGKGEASHGETNKVKVILTPVAQGGEPLHMGSPQPMRPDVDI
jgi:hypothetical protein